MKVLCERAALVDALNVVGSVVPNRTPTPVLRCLKLSAADGLLMLAATDLEVALKMGVEQVEIEQTGEALVPADKITQIVRACDDPTLTLEMEDHTMHIRGADAHFKIFGFDPNEFPPVVDFDDATIDCEIAAGVLQSLIGLTLFAAASEHSRYAINGVLFDRDKRNLRLIATDGRRLAMAKGECLVGEDTTSCIIPSKALKLITKLLDDPEASVRIAVEDNRIRLSVGESADAAVLSSSLVEGAFPPFEDVIPSDHDKKVTFDTTTLSSAIRRAALLTNEESKGVRLNFENDSLTLSSRAPEMGEATVEVKLEDYQGEPLEIGFNPGFITDALNVVDSEKVTMELKAPNKPGVLRTDKDFTYVIMPVNLQ